MATVFERVKQIIVKRIGAREDEVVPDAFFGKDLDADSLDSVDLIEDFEKEFSVEIPADVAQNLLTVQQVVDFLVEKGMGD
ncbi:MAG: acyl carrier protein [Planctomycetota bacterium]|jgi:acyl carrier protein